ncbi:MAG: diguanylate cyclase domain-containing protein [Acetatifactor sp.]
MKPLNQEGFLAFFDKMYDFMPKSFEDYDRFLHKELKSFFDGCGIQKVEYSVSIPSELAFLKVVPKRSITGPVETEEWKTLHFEYPFETDGKIEYFVYTEGDSKECGEIEIIFRQLYYTLKSLMLSACCEKLINTDCVMGIPNIKSYFQFGNRVIAQGRAEQYMAVYFNIHNFRTVHRSLAYFECNSMMERYYYTLQTLMDENEFVARLGGDNFVAFILKEHERRFIEKIQNITIDYEKNGQLLTFTFGATIGMASCAGAKSTGEVMVKTSAAYQASRENRVLLSYYDEKVNHEIVERRAILSRFNNGIREREFFAVYQPRWMSKPIR